MQSDLIEKTGEMSEFIRSIPDEEWVLNGHQHVKDRKFDSFIQKLFFSLLSYVEEGNYLELGCGTGVFCKYLSLFSEKKVVPFGVDIRAQSIELARKNNKEFRSNFIAADYFKVDLSKLPRFSTAYICICKMEHWSKVIKIIHSLLMKGKCSTIILFNYEYDFFNITDRLVLRSLQKIIRMPCKIFFEQRFIVIKKENERGQDRGLNINSKEPGIRTIELFITEQCNMNCGYCYHQRSDQVLTLNQGKKILDRVHLFNPGKIQIMFFGGEPLLYPQTILSLAAYARKLWKQEKAGLPNPLFSICTNGTYFNPRVFNKFKDFQFSVQVSCDGDEATNNLYRKADWRRIFANIIKMQLLFPDLLVRMTYTPKTVKKLFENVRFLHDQLGIQHIMHHAVIEDDWTAEAIKEYKRQLEKLYYYRRNCLRKGVPLRLYFIDKALKTMHQKDGEWINFCEAGKSQVAIRSNGDLHICHRAASKGLFKLGNIFDSSKIKRGVFREVSKQKSPSCKHCIAVRNCHTCMVVNYHKHKDLLRPTEAYCGICKTEHVLARHFLPAEFDQKVEFRLYHNSKR